MEHQNPLPAGGKKFITVGEIMLRLTPPNYDKIRMASMFEASYGGSEANIALALANLGVDSTFFSVVPDNSLGKSAVRWLRSNDVHCDAHDPLHAGADAHPPPGRLLSRDGLWHPRQRGHLRPQAQRHHGIRLSPAWTWTELLDGFDWLHLSGITPALAPNCRQLVLQQSESRPRQGA